MADESTETVSDGGTSEFDARAAFIAGELGGDDVESDDAAKGDDKDEPADDDSDLDEEERDEVEDDSDEGDESDSEDDEDSDLDEDDDEGKADKDVDAETSKRLSQVRRTDQRLREQREKAFAKREAELETREAQLSEQLKPHLEKLDKFEKAAARVGVDPVGVLISLGLTEDRFEHAAQVLYTLSKKDDPKARQAAATLIKERERDAEIERLTKRDQERDEHEKERERRTAADRELDAYFSKVAKATSDKTPLAAAFLKADPTEARGVMEIIAHRLAKETGSLPKERDVIIALEKDRRGILRKLGIDPKTVSAKKATAAIEASQTKTTPKKGDKKTAKPTAKADDDLPLTKEAFIKGNLH